MKNTTSYNYINLINPLNKNLNPNRQGAGIAIGISTSLNYTQLNFFEEFKENFHILCVRVVHETFEGIVFNIYAKPNINKKLYKC